MTELSKTKYDKCFSDKQGELRKFWQEAKELTLIFGKIISSLKK